MSGDSEAFKGQLSPAANGAVLQPDYMARTSKVYAIYESEMDSLSMLNHVATAFLALSGSSVSFAFGLWVNNAISPALTPDGKAIVALGVPVGVVFAIAFGILAFIAYRKRGGTLHSIKNESRRIPQAEVTM